MSRIGNFDYLRLPLIFISTYFTCNPGGAGPVVSGYPPSVPTQG